VTALSAAGREPTPSLEPVLPGERLVELDVIRGFALFGVLLAYAVWNLGAPPEETWSAADRLWNRVLGFAVDSKAFSLFTFLFGLGFSIQLSRVQARGASVVTVYSRRLIVLLGIGLLHATLLRNGDVLVPYAVLGFALLAARNASGRTLALLAVASFLYSYLARAAGEAVGLPFVERPQTEGLGHFQANLLWLRYWYANAIFEWPGMLPLFFLGLHFGRRPLRDSRGRPAGELWRILVAGLVITALAFTARELLMAKWSGPSLPPARQMTLGFLWTTHAWSLASAYAVALVLSLRRPRGRRVLAPLGAVGRMALTNYLLQAVLIVFVCIAFDLYDRVTPTLGVLLALGAAAVQVPASVWWLDRFRFGPVEWIWRSLTYGRPQPMRIAVRAVFALSSILLAALSACRGAPPEPAKPGPTLTARLHRTLAAHSVAARQVAFSADGRVLATSGVDGAVKLWSMPDAALTRTLAHPAGVTSLAYSPDGRWLVSGSSDRGVRIWRVADGSLARTLTGHGGTVWSVAVSPDGRTVASSGEDKTVKLWRLEDGALLRTLTGHELNVWSVDFTPDGQQVVSGSFDRTVKVWRTLTGALERTLVGHGQAVVGVDVSPRGDLVASGSDDSSARLWRASDGALVRTLTGGSNHVYTVAFSPDGEWLASGGREKGALGTLWTGILGSRRGAGRSPTVRLWRVRDGALQQALAGHSGNAWFVAFSPDGRWLASSGSDEPTVNLWRLERGQR